MFPPRKAYALRRSQPAAPQDPPPDAVNTDAAPAYTDEATQDSDAQAGGNGQQLPSPDFSYPGSPQTPQFNPSIAPGGSPIYYGQQIGAQDPSMSYIPDLSTNDPNRLYRNVQNVGYNLGAGINADLYNQGQNYGNLFGQYGNLMNQSYSQLAQTPGYTNEEANNIVRQQGFQGAMATPEQYSALAPNADEIQGMKGNTGSYMNYYNPGVITGANTASANQQRNAVDLSETGIRNAIQGQQNAYNQAIDPNKLAASNYYENSINDVLTATGGALDKAQTGAQSQVNAALSRPGLNVTDEYKRQAGMTDAEVEQAANMGARDVGLRYQSQMNDAARQAAASGNASPLAVGALQSRLAQQSATEAADARVNAQLAARQAQRNAATGVQQTELGAEQYQTGAGLQGAQYMGNLASGNAQYAGNLASQDVQNVENTRLGAQQYLTGAQMQAASNIGQQGQQGAQYIGNLRAGTEAGIGSANVAGQQYIQNTGTAIAQAQDQAAANRALQQYGIRQGNQQYQIGSQYQQGMGVNSALSQGYGNVAGARIAGQNNYRNWATGQTGQYLGAQQTNNQQRIQNYGTMTGAMNNTANSWGNYSLQKSRQPGTFDKVVGTLAGVAGALA